MTKKIDPRVQYGSVQPNGNETSGDDEENEQDMNDTEIIIDSTWTDPMQSEDAQVIDLTSVHSKADAGNGEIFVDLTANSQEEVTPWSDDEEELITREESGVNETEAEDRIEVNIDYPTSSF